VRGGGRVLWLIIAHGFEFVAILRTLTPAVPLLLLSFVDQGQLMVLSADTLPDSSGKSEANLEISRNRSRLRGKAVFTGVIGHSFKAP